MMIVSRTLATTTSFWFLLSTLKTTTTTAFECQEEIATYSTNDLATLLLEITAPLPSLNGLVQRTVVSALQNGVHLRKICGSCAEYPHVELCPATVYGFDVPHSGLLIAPLSNENNDDATSTATPLLAKGTNMLNVHFHGAIRHPGAAPSSAAWPPNILGEAGFDVFLGLVFSGTSGTYTLLPDYQGFGESSTKLFPSTLVQQGYVTGTWPVIQAARNWVADDFTNCESAIDNQLLVTGYSEGAYAAVAVLDAIAEADDTDLKVVQTVVGAGPFRPHLQFLQAFKAFSTPGVLDPSLRFITALTAMPFSSTTTDVDNFGANQDILDPAQRQVILEAFRGATGNDDLNAAIDLEDPFAIYNPTFVDFLIQAVVNGIDDPCQSDLVVPGVTDFLCAAILDQDLSAALESIEVPVTIMHSLEDALIPAAANLPDFSANPDFLTFVPALTGSHQEAAVTFGFGLLQQLFLDPTTRLVNFVDVVDTTAEGGCVPEKEENAKFKGTVICSGGKILKDYSKVAGLSICHMGNCGFAAKPLITGFDSDSVFEVAALLSVSCDVKGSVGLCQRKTVDNNLVFTNCPAGEGAIVTISEGKEDYWDRRLLRGKLAADKEELNITEELVEVDGEVVVVHSLFA